MFGNNRKPKQKEELYNLLEMKPVLKEHIGLKKDEERVTLLLPRRSWLEKQSVKFLRQPAVVQVHLDPLGSEFIDSCNGQLTVRDIADRIYNKYGEEAEPLLPRITKFIEILEINDWLTWSPHDNSGKYQPTQASNGI
ncbi:PqqD family protein [Paenibacillus pini]|uniref:Coenzyme PQQ synthesis protein D n=1 Tax=Paenibacillus pini JCM 16418 TaxID=1236976 RepID=W7YTH7_9BACL|nr:PqqD family protein [Paenibacillus pini]GAF07931.1 hypothetical protein JCM16418_1965 [Paenibacillus pini JCM 16418]